MAWQSWQQANNRNINNGGTNGRARTQHNGTPGTQSGGTNAQGSARRVANWSNAGGQLDPLRDMYFQYGHDQWGYVNGANNKVNWNYHAPKNMNAANIADWKTVSKFAGAAPGPVHGSVDDAYKDANYFMQLAPIQSQYNIDRLDLEQKLSEMKYQWPRQRDENLKQFATDRNNARSNFINNGLNTGWGESGAIDQWLNEQRSYESNKLKDLRHVYGNVAQDRVRDMMEELKRGHKNTLAAILEGAKDRYLFENDGKKPKVKTGWTKRGKTWFFTDKRGVTVSMGTRGPKGGK